MIYKGIKINKITTTLFLGSGASVVTGAGVGEAGAAPVVFALPSSAGAGAFSS